MKQRDRAGPLRVTVIGPSDHLTTESHSGFASRHAAWLAELRSDPAFIVSVVGMPAREAPPLIGLDAEMVDLGVRWGLGRLRRMKESLAAVLGVRLVPWQQTLVDAVRRTSPDALLTLGPWHAIEYRPLFSRWPTVHAFEEDVLALPSLAVTSLQGRLLRRMESWLGWLSRSQPRAVIIISPGEERAAKQRFRTRIVRHVPFSLDPSWRVCGEPTDRAGDVALCLATLNNAHNAEGLAALLGAMRQLQLTDIPVRLVSDSGLHPVLVPFLDLPWVRHVPGREGRYNYEGARVAIVPARRATGVKTTVLQAWSQHVPVVAYSRTIQVMGEGASVSAAHADQADALARTLKALWLDERVRDDLRRRGREVLDKDYGWDDRSVRELKSLLRQASEAPR